MQIRLAETAGFCFGVERAVALAEQTARTCKNAVTLGPIIHNRHVVERFERLGLHEISSAEEAEPGQTVVIRAHGIPVSEQRMLSARGAAAVDATCPFVKKIHVIAQKAERDGGAFSSSGRLRTRRSLPLQAIPPMRTSSRPPKHCRHGSRSARTGAICRFVWFRRQQGRKNCGNHAGKLQKKCVQIAKYLIQYAKLRKCGRKKQLIFQRVVMRWSLSGTQEVPIRGVLP